MFDIGWTELLLIGIVALIVIGPKDLPEMFRTLGRFTAKARGMAREFSRAMEAAADEAGVKDVAKDLRSATSAKSMGLDAVKDAVGKFEKWDPMKGTKPSAPASPASPASPAATVVTTPTPVIHKGPATQELADKLAAKRAATRAKAAAGPSGPSSPASAGASSAEAKAAARPESAAKTAAKTATKTVAKTGAKTTAGPKPARAVRPAKESDA